MHFVPFFVFRTNGDKLSHHRNNPHGAQIETSHGDKKPRNPFSRFIQKSLGEKSLVQILPIS